MTHVNEPPRDGNPPRGLDVLELTTRTKNALTDALAFEGLADATAEQIRDWCLEQGDAALLRIPNFGRKSLNDLKDALAERGLISRSSPPFFTGAPPLPSFLFQSVAPPLPSDKYPIEKGVPLPISTSLQPEKYPWKRLEIGDSFFIPDISIAAARSKIHSAHKRHAPFRFIARPERNGVRIWRKA